MPVIAMTREMGSKGKDVAMALAEELDLRLVQHELVEHVAERMHADTSSVNHFLEGTASLLERWGMDADDLSLRTAEEILDIAEQDNVLFRGWGATHVLMRVPHALCVRVCAPMRARTVEMMTRLGIEDERLAEAEIRKSDDAHSRVLSKLFHADWDDPLEYDATLNLERMSVAACVGVIKQLVASEDYAVTDHSRAVLRHLRTEARIKAALREHNLMRRAGPSFEVILDPLNGEVTLRGVVYDDEFKNAAVEVVQSVEGVGKVIDDMYVPRIVTFGP